MAIHGLSMDKRGKTIDNIVSDTLTFMDDMGLSMAASDNPLIAPLICDLCTSSSYKLVCISKLFESAL